MLHHHARFAIKALLHLAAELALHLWLPALAHYTLPITALWLLVAAWREPSQRPRQLKALPSVSQAITSLGLRARACSALAMLWL